MPSRSMTSITSSNASRTACAPMVIEFSVSVAFPVREPSGDHGLGAEHHLYYIYKVRPSRYKLLKSYVYV